jgi:5-fold beta-flower domain-containing protein
MKKLLILAAICLCGNLAHAQFLKPDGSFVNSAGVLGYFHPDTVQDKSHTIVGFIEIDGTVHNSTRAIIGYVKTDGTMEDAHHTVLGYFMKAGYLEDASHKLIAQLRTQNEATLKLYFFP